MPLHPTVAVVLDQFAASGRPAVSAGTPEQARRLTAASRPAYGKGPDLARVEPAAITTRTGAIPGRFYAGPGRLEGLVVHLHGGGWMVGGLDDFDAVARVLAERSRCAVLLVDYRLAPEAPFPAAVQDAIDTVLWADANKPALTGGPVPLVVAGDSAGGDLATVAAGELRGRVGSALQPLIHPVTDGDFGTPSYTEFAAGGPLTRRDMEWFFGHYARGVPRGDPLLHPAARTDLAGVAPAHLVTAGYDVLRDEGETDASRLAGAGVPATLRRYGRAAPRTHRPAQLGRHRRRGPVRHRRGHPPRLCRTKPDGSTSMTGARA